MIAEGFARLARYDRFEGHPLSGVRSLIDHDLALSVSIRNLTGELAKQRPVQARKRSVIEMAFDDGADVGEMTITMCRGFVELASAAHGTITVVIGMAHEFPLVRHLGNLPCCVQYVMRHLCLVNIRYGGEIADFPVHYVVGRVLAHHGFELLLGNIVAMLTAQFHSHQRDLYDLDRSVPFFATVATTPGFRRFWDKLSTRGVVREDVHEYINSLVVGVPASAALIPKARPPSNKQP